jgi:initiation factor 1A
MGKTKKHASLAQKRRNQERLNNQDLNLADEMQSYAMVVKKLGDRRFQCKCSDGKTRICKIRGKFRGRLVIQVHDILLLSLRSEEGESGSKDEFEKADILQKYRPEEVHELKKLGEFSERDFQLEPGEELGTVEAAVDDDGGGIVWTQEDIETL